MQAPAPVTLVLGGKRIFKNFLEEKTWDESRSACTALKGKLAKIDSQADSDELRKAGFHGWIGRLRIRAMTCVIYSVTAHGSP
jgi:hypothetical protein